MGEVMSDIAERYDKLTKPKKMTPKEKAEDLLEKMLGDNNHYLNKNIEIDKLIAKQCALICVEEIIKIFDDTNGADYRLEYWQEVKQEINQNKEDE